MAQNIPTSPTHLVLIPSYNTGPILLETVRAAVARWRPVHVVFDGSTDGSPELLEREKSSLPGLRITRLPRNHGKGAAVLAAMQEARAAGTSHALVMDADGQHPADRIREFMRLSLEHPEAMILGQPIFGPTAPKARVQGRRIGNAFTRLETAGGEVGDSLFGFRVYPLAPALTAMAGTRLGRGYDFDTQILVRLYWQGVIPIRVPVPVNYPSPAAGGVSHFHYVKHNALLTLTHVSLLMAAPAGWRRRRLARRRAS
jgi:glycosyltransferase involved in cell wall biosynthesis